MKCFEQEMQFIDEGDAGRYLGEHSDSGRAIARLEPNVEMLATTPVFVRVMERRLYTEDRVEVIAQNLRATLGES